MTALTEALARATAEYIARNPASAALQERGSAVMPGGNTRSSLWHAPFPLRIVSGTGCRIEDADGHRYIDFLGEFTSGLAGHSHPALSRAIAGALGRGMNLSASGADEVALAEALCGRFPSLERVRFCNSGTEANMMALALACAATGRRRVMVFEGGYHGALLAFSPAGTAVLAPHDFQRLPYNDLARAQAAAGPELAAILVEPMQGAGGCLPADPAFLQGLREIADRTGAVLIFDEVQTARLSAGGRQALLGITPDMTTLGKFFGGGLAFGAFGGKAGLMDLFDPRRPGALMHAGTFNNNALAMAAGLAAVTEVATAQALAALNTRGEAFRAALNARFAAARVPFEATGLGSIMTIHARHAAPAQARDAAQLLFLELLSEGIFLAARGLIALSLPIAEPETEAFLKALDLILTRQPALCDTAQ